LINRLARARNVTAYYLSWIMFGSVGLLLNMFCVLLLPLPNRNSYGRAVRATIRRLFGAWIAWLHASRTIIIEWVGFDGGVRPGTVYIANHPSIVDATLLLARLPDAVCIFKPALMSNPAVGPAAIMAGYVRGDTGLDLMRAAAARVAAGQSLLIFPEGTRTAEGKLLEPMKPGFALIADRARAPVQLVIIRSTPGVGSRGRPWWPPPETLPGQCRIVLDQTWPYEPGRPAAQLTQAVERRICEVLGAAKP
jgi:1-acyl-sn-glycerol-3-phosphate acyltransferase